MLHEINSAGGSMRWRFLKPTVMLIGLLMILFIAPVSNASSLATTINGEWFPSNTDVVRTRNGQGPLVITANTQLTFTGGVDGVMTGSLKVILLDPPFGHFTVVTTGEFVGKIAGIDGTAKFHSVVNGTGQPAFPCCYEGPVTFYDGTEGLEGLTATGVFTRVPNKNNQYSLDVIFR